MSANGDTPDDRRRSVVEFFSTHAPSWRDRYAESRRDFDAYEYQSRARHALAFLHRIEPTLTRALLDVGCGAGVQAAGATRLGWRVVGADLSKRMLAQASRELPGPRWVAATAEALPFRRDSFAAIMTIGVLGYLESPLDTLRALRSYLHPGGYLIISWNCGRMLLNQASDVVSAVPDALYLAAKRLLIRHPRPAPTYPPGFYDQYHLYWTEEEFLALMQSAGFVLIDSRPVNFGRFRFMDKALWPERVDIWVTQFLERMARFGLLGPMRNRARTHVCLARRTSP